MENNNKSQYEWFKGPQAKKQDKDLKQRVKDGFKWAKIFSYVALFTFSMFGCVQVFTVTTDNAVGRGVEIFTDSNDVAPSISTTTFTKEIAYGPTSDTDQTIADVPDIPIYSSTTNSLSSIWVNKHSDADLLGKIHSDVELSQGVELKDAYKGVNSGIKNMASDKTEFTYEDSKGEIQDIPTSAAHNTSAANDLFGIDEDDVEEFNNEKISTLNNGNVMVYSSVAKTFDLSAKDDEDVPVTPVTPETNISFFIPIQESKEWDSVNEVYKPTYTSYEIIIDYNSFDLRDDHTKVRAAMAESFLLSYFGDDMDSTLFNFLGSEDEATAIALAEDSVYLNDWDTEDVFYANSTQLHRTSVLSQLLVASGFKIETDYMKWTDEDGEEQASSDKDVISSIEYQEGHMVGYLGENTKFRPITTWGDAFSLGPFYGFFVYPIGAITSSMVNGMGDLSGWESMMTIFLVVFSIRMLTFALSYKSTMAQSRMQDLNGKKAIIEAKYTQYEGNKQMEMRKRQEVADLYKKNGINPMASLGTMFLTMPFFLAIWRVIGGIPHLKAASWLGITFSATSYQEFFAGEWQYLPLMLIAAAIQLFSQLYPRLINRKKNNERLNAAQKEAMKKANKTQNITMGVFVFMSIIFTAGIQIYWIIGGLWRIIEVRATHHLKEKHKSKKVK